MSILDGLFSGKKKNYQSLYPNKVEGLTDTQKRDFDLIATRYKRLSFNSPKGNKLQQAFFDRFDKAQKDGVKLDIFFQAEEEAYEIYKKKITSESKTDDKQPEADNPPSIKDVGDKQEKKLIEQYSRVRIHEKASPIIERLYGGLIEFEKKFANGLLQTTKIIIESEFHQIVFSINYSLEDFTHSKGKSLPFVFSQYCFNLDKEVRDQKQLENEILTKISIVFDKVKKVVLWGRRMNIENISNNPFSYFYVEKNRLDYHEFFNLLNEETDKLILAFDLHSSV